jgi:hypothetical protein
MAVSPTVFADVPVQPIVATLTCDAVPTPGRVRCEAEARVPPGLAITWGDLILLSTPPFLSPLRGRIAPSEATVRAPELWHWALALVGRTKGTGDVKARVRLVTCTPEKTCTARQVEVTGHVTVGE